MDKYKVAVLMSTYNGEKYIRKQLDSILAQKGVEVSLYIRDDGSKDNTPAILEEYSQKYNNVNWYKGDKNLGACGSFFELMAQKRDVDYYSLSDQDDVWDDDKIISAIEFMKNAPDDKPVLYYSNLRIVDQNEVFLRNSHSSPMLPGARYSYLSDVFVTGCTAVYNQSLASIIAEIKPKDFSMHDTWIYMVASMFGTTLYDFKPHMNYRQHGNNVIGTRKKKISFESLRREFGKYFNWKDQSRYKCARLIRKQFDGKLDKKTLGKIDEFVNYKKSIGATLKLAFDKDLDSSNFYRKLRFRITVLLRNA